MISKQKSKSLLLLLSFFSATYYLLHTISPVNALDASSAASSILDTVQKKAEDASASSIRDLVREKVKEKLDITNKKPKAVAGKLKQITDLNIEIISTDNKTSFASVSEDTLYFRVTNGKKKEIKFEELALDDFVVAMGYKNSKDVLETKRLVAYDKTPEAVKSVMQGKVKTATKSLITISDKAGRIWKIKVSGKTEISSRDEAEDTKITDVGENDSIIVVGTVTGDTLNTTRIHLVN